MKEKIIKILNDNGYEVPETITLERLEKMLLIHKVIVDSLEEAGIYILKKRKTLDI